MVHQLITEPTHDAVMALLEAESTLTVYPDGPPDRSLPPYVTAWLSVDREDAEYLDGGTTRVWWRLTTHSVASSRRGSLQVADLVRRALLDQRPVVEGSEFSRVKHDNGRPPSDDESTGAKVLDTIDQWAFQSWPTRSQP